SGHVWSIAWTFDASGRGVVIDVVDHTAELGTIPLVAFAEDGTGELYIVSYDGRILKLMSDAPAPAAPTSLTSQTSGRTVTLAWTGVSGATQYRVEAGSRAGAVDLATLDTGSPQTTFVANGVGDGVYYVRVRALVGAAASTPSNEVIVSVGGATPC